jgi:hypothetical protein
MILGYGKESLVAPFVKSRGGRMATAEEIIENPNLPVAVSGISKRIVPNMAALKQLDWYSIDTGYFGNNNGKSWFRITRNGWQNTGPVCARDNTRLRYMRVDRHKIAQGSKILIVPPHPKVSLAYNIADPDTWTAQTIAQIKQYTDRPIEIRSRPPSRHDRVYVDRFVDTLTQDVHAVVVYSSNCAVESLIHQIPVVCLGESAAQPLANQLSQIDNLPVPKFDDVETWMRHLSYCQFSRKEIQSGAAWQILHA